MKANEVIKTLNADLKVVAQDLKDADHAHDAAVQQLGASAARADVDAKTNEIKTQKYTDIETMMTKDTQLRPTRACSLVLSLGQGAVEGLKKNDAAETSFRTRRLWKSTRLRRSQTRRSKAWPTRGWASCTRVAARFRRQTQPTTPRPR